MTKAARLFTLLASALMAALAPVQAAAGEIVSVETWIEQWDPATQQWVRVEDGAERLVASRAPARPKAIAHYGPFQVLNDREAALMGVTDIRSPQHFAAMLRDFPQLATLKLVECPGTEDDRGNFAVGRMIRAAGLETHVPRGGSVRSGAVELFLAGKTRRIDDGAEFAVHSWLDNYGREASDYAADAPQNRLYLDYYAEMGMEAGQARAFYDMTNSVPHASAKWLTAQDMRSWVEDETTAGDASEVPAVETLVSVTPEAAPQIAYLGFSQLDSQQALH